MDIYRVGYNVQILYGHGLCAVLILFKLNYNLDYY